MGERRWRAAQQAAVVWPKPPTAEKALSVVAKAMHGSTTADGTFVGGRPDTLRMDNGTELIGTGGGAVRRGGISRG